MKALAFGEILWDIINNVPHLGGAPLNFAAHLAKAGAESYIVSRVGEDKLGQQALEMIKAKGVLTEYTSVDDKLPTGTVDVFLKNGQPDYTIHENVAYDNIMLHKSHPTFDGFDLFYFGTLVQRSEISRQTLYSILNSKIFEFIFYDVNLRKNCYAEEDIIRSLQYSNFVKLNGDELKMISLMLYGLELPIEEFLQKSSRDYDVKVFIITDGANGCYVYENSLLKHAEGVKVEVKDAIGAGDSFSAAFMYRYFKTRDAYHSAIIANKVGAYVASQQGAIPEYSEELKALLSE